MRVERGGGRGVLYSQLAHTLHMEVVTMVRMKLTPHELPTPDSGQPASHVLFPVHDTLDQIHIFNDDGNFRVMVAPL